MVKVCQTCGEIGFRKALVYCTNCWDTVEHIYCLGLSPCDIGGSFSWTCDSCTMEDKQRVGIVMFGDQVDEMTKSCRLSPFSEKPVSGVPVVGPIWRGGIEIVGTLGSSSGKLDGLEVFMPKTSYSKIVKVKQSMQPSIWFSMKSRDALWPKHFDEVGAAHSDIELFMFPEISRSETDYDNLVEDMIANDLAMTSHIGNLELIIFTSLEQEVNQKQIQGKYYLWGMFKGEKYRRCKTSKGEKTNAEKGRKIKSIRPRDCTKKSNISPHNPLSGRIGFGIKHGKESTEKASSVKCSDKPLPKIKIYFKGTSPSVGPQPITTSQSRVTCNYIPSLNQGCKRARSKRCRISSKLNKKAGVCKAVIADFPGKEWTDQQGNGVVSVKRQHTLDTSSQVETCTIIEQVDKKKPVTVTDEVDNPTKEDGFTSVIRGDVMKDGLTNRASPLLDYAEKETTNDETKEAEQRSWDSTMEIDDPSDSYGINVKETEVEHPTWDSDMELDEPSDDVVKDCVELQPQSNVFQALDSETQACLTPLLNSEEFPLSEVPNRAINVTRDSCSDENLEIPDRILCSTVNVYNHIIVKNMIPKLNEGSTGGGLTVAAPMVETDPENHSCLIPLLHYNKEPDVHEANPPSHREINLYFDEKALGIHTNSVSDDNQNIIEDAAPGFSEISVGLTAAAPVVLTDSKNCSCLINPPTRGENNSCLDEKALGIHTPSADDNQNIIEDTAVPGISESSAGLNQLDVRVDQPECHASDLLPEMDSCRTPLIDFEEPGPSSSSNTTLVLELDDEEEDEETTMKRTEIFDEGSDVITASMLKMANDFHEPSSDTLRVQVGRYMIKSDLAPILTKILNKYGDIALGCSKMPEILLEDICKAYQDLEPVSFSGLRSHHLERLKSLCQLCEALEIDVKWLSKRCEDLEKMALQIRQYLPLEKDIAQCNIAIESLEEKPSVNRASVAKLLEENLSKEKELASLEESRQKLNCEIEYVKSESRSVLGKSLVDGLF